MTVSTLLPTAVLAALFPLTLMGAAVSVDPHRVAELASLLPDKPVGLGPPITDRAPWEQLGKDGRFRSIMAKAEALIATPIPEQTDDLYLDFSRTGNRDRWQHVAFARRARIPTLVLAECVENRGRFIPAIEELVRAVCAERTWVMPAHDRSLADFKGKLVTIDLASSALGWNLAMTDYLLGNKLKADTHTLIRDNLRRRIFDSYQQTLDGKASYNWWTRANHNWNAVCLACVTGAALAAMDDKTERATYAAAAEVLILNFLSGFTPDGYCSEGLGYWNYGYGHFILLTETLRQATGGKLDLFALKGARAPALFPLKLEITDGVYPAFADCGVRTRPDTESLAYINARYGLGLPADETRIAMAPGHMLAETMIFAFPEKWESARVPGETPPFSPLRSWFKDAGVLICRPGTETSGRLGAAVKGGHNAEHHNHNDVGSYAVVLDKTPVLLDPGAEVYTARTFSSKRYESKVLNSYGHPVPVVAGQLQQKGRQAASTILRADFSDTCDTLEMDFTAAYAVPSLKKLVRTFIFTRGEAGSLIVKDSVLLAKPDTFETALITLGDWTRESADSLLVFDGDATVRVRVDAGGLAWTPKAERIKEHVRTRTLPLRIGIVLDDHVTQAALTLTITPATASD